jgi:hypothetical protein
MRVGASSMKDVVQYLPWAGLAVGLAALFVREGKGGEWALRSAWVPLLVAVLVAVGATLTKGDIQIALWWAASGAFAGAILGVVSSRLGTSAIGELLMAFGLAAFIVGVSQENLALSNLPRFCGLVVGLAAGSFASFNSGSRAPMVLAVAVFVAGIVALLSRVGYRDEMRQAAPLAAWTALLSVGLVWGSKRAMAQRSRWLGTALAIAAMAGLSWLVFSSYLGEGDLGIVALTAVAAALLTSWAVPTDRQSVATWGIAAVVWLGMATFAFSTAYGLGMAVAGFVGAATVLVLGRRDLLPPVGVLVGLASYRLFREQNNEVVQAFDIGQHYAMVGFVLGIVVLVAAADAIVRRRDRWGSGLTGALVALIAGAIVVGAAAFFGPKGAIGLVVGLAVAPIVSQLTSARPPWAFVAAAALQCAVLVAYRPLSYDLSLDRDGKLRLLVWLAAAIVALYIVLRLLERQKREVANANA